MVGAIAVAVYVTSVLVLCALAWRDRNRPRL